ncbi:MAG TPA: glycosyltransferase family 4 protein, partial [Acidimicrobiales bacterium]|nr:glycosyltransferase family 4 protein [Acidimicrobiales bacterium]
TVTAVTNRQIDQVIPTIVKRDAVSAHTFEVQRILRGLGFASEIYAQNISGEVASRVRPIAELDGDPDRWLLYQASIGAPVAEVFAAHRAPKLLNYHNITPVELIGWWEPHLAGELVLGRRQLRELAPLTTLAIAVSEYNQSELIEAGFADTAVAPLLTDLSTIAEPDPATVAKLKSDRSGGGASWLFVGQLAPHKAQHDIVKALAFYRQVYDPAARLYLIGRETSPGYVQAIRHLIAELGLSEAVHLVGAVSDGGLAAHYDAADVLVCCSEHEGFCAPLIEAMYHRVPIVAYGAAAVPETVSGTGVVLPAKPPSLVAAAVHRVLTDAALRADLVDRASARAHHFDVDRSRKAFADAVMSVVGVRGAARSGDAA